MQFILKNQVWVNILILMALSLTLIGCGSGVDEQQMVQTARSYVDQNKLREAALELKNVLQENPDNAEARYLLGVINIDVGDPASAEKEFRRAIDAGWQEELARIGQARAMINLRDFKKVIDEIDVKDGYSANASADLYALRALAQAGLGNMSQAAEIINNAVEMDANAFHVQKVSMQLHLVNGDMERAGESLKRAQAKYGENREILLLSATMDNQNKKFTEASQAYKKVIELDSNKLVTIYGRKARLGLARIEIVNKEFDKADMTLKPLFEQSAGDAETNFVGGLLAFEQGKLELAEERLLNVLKVVPNHAATQLLFGTVSYAHQNYEQAAYYISKYISVMPDNLGARKLLGRTYMRLGQHDEAKASLQHALEDNSEDAELMALVSLSQLQGGDTVSGIEGLEKAVKVAPDSSSLRNELARAYISAGETENAIKELNTILAEGGDQKQTEALMISAHITDGHYDKAIGVVLDMLHVSPDDPAVLSLAGNVFVMSDDRPEARKYFNKALKIKPDYLPATMLLAKLEEIDGLPDKAEHLYKQLANSNKEKVAPLMALARLAQVQNQKEKMIEWLKLVIERAPRHIKSRKIMAEYYLREKQLDKSGLLIKEAIEIAPRDKTLLVLLARWQMADGQYNKALSSLSELVTRMPDSIFVRTMLGEAYLRLNQIADADRQLEIVLEKQPYYVPALLLKTGLELRASDYVKALALAEKIQKIQPDLHLGYELAGDALMIKKDYAAAENNYVEALRHTQSAEIVIKHSEAASRAGEFEAATKTLLAWLDNNPDDVRVLQFLGAAYQNMKLNQKAITTYEKVLVLQPDNVVSLNNLAWLYLLVNDTKALELAERAHKVSSDDAGVKDTYGWALVQHGQPEEGLRILEQVMKVLPGVPEVQYHYAVALIKSGEERWGRKMLRKLLDSGKSFEGRDSAEQIMK